MSGESEALERVLHYAQGAPPPVSKPEYLRALEQAQAAPHPRGGEIFRIGALTLARVRSHGSVTFYDPASGTGAPRRLCTLDPGGELVEVCRWSEGRGLVDARLRLPDGKWLRLLPGQGAPEIWERADAIEIGEARIGEQWQPLTSQQAIDFERIVHIPAAWKPARLSGGAGTVLLNFLAQLLEDQDAPRVRYRGRYPTAQLFDALQESFVLESSEDPRWLRAQFSDRAQSAAFGSSDIAPDVDFIPAPFELCTTGPESAVLLRERPERVFYAGTSYALARTGGTRTPGARRVWKRGEAWEFGLFVLGAPVELHGRIELREQSIEATAPLQQGADRFVPAELYWRDALLLCTFAQAPAALAVSLLELMDESHVGFRPLPRDLARLEGVHLFIREGLGEVFASRATDRSGPEQIELALVLLGEIGVALLPALLALSQQRIERAGAEERARLLAPANIAAAKAEIERRAGALTTLLQAIVAGTALR